MTSRSEECRRYAEECEFTAALTKEPERRRIYDELARQWRAMAKRFEVRERRVAEKTDTEDR